jgi:hypothetical protein
MAVYRLYFRDGYSGSREANDHAFLINEREASNGRMPMIHGIDVGRQDPNALPEWYNGSPTLELPHPRGSSSRWEGSHAVSHLKMMSGVDTVMLGTSLAKGSESNILDSSHVDMPTVGREATEPGFNSDTTQPRPVTVSQPDANGVQTKIGFDAQNISVPFGGSAYQELTAEDENPWSTSVMDKRGFFGEDIILRN